MTILLIENNKKTADFIVAGLKREGHLVDLAHDGQEGWSLLKSSPYELLILDIMLPKMSGFDIIKFLKTEHYTLPILVLSSEDSIENRVLALNLGADDFVSKPFSFAELIARINALSRRSLSYPTTNQLYFDKLALDRIGRTVKCDGKPLDLQAKEFALLELFMRNSGRILSKHYILDHIWNINFDPQTNVVDVLVCRLRSKLEKSLGRRPIVTVRGMGYSLKSNDDL